MMDVFAARCLLGRNGSISEKLQPCYQTRRCRRLTSAKAHHLHLGDVRHFDRLVHLVAFDHEQQVGVFLSVDDLLMRIGRLPRDEFIGQR